MSRDKTLTVSLPAPQYRRVLAAAGLHGVSIEQGAYLCITAGLSGIPGSILWPLRDRINDAVLTAGETGADLAVLLRQWQEAGVPEDDEVVQRTREAYERQAELTQALKGLRRDLVRG